MSNEIEKINMGGPLDRLKIKRMAKPQPIFKIQLKRGNVGKKIEVKEVPGYLSEDEPVDVGTEEVVVRKITTDVDVDNPIKERVAIVFADKRRDVDVNRALILTRLNKYTNIRVVEKKRLTQVNAPVAMGADKEEPEVSSFKVPLTQQSLPSELGEESIQFKRPKQTFTIAEKMDTDLSLEKETGEEIEKIGLDQEEEEKVEKLDEEQKEEIVVFKPKRGRPKVNKEKAKDDEKEDENEDEKAKEELGTIPKDKPDKVKQTRKTYEDVEFGKEVKIGKNFWSTVCPNARNSR